MGREYENVGVVRELARFPFKSMSGEKVMEMQLGFHGATADRRFAFLNLNDTSGFPYLTQREFPRLVRYQAYLADPNKPRDSPVRVRTPDGRDLAVDDPSLVEEIQRDGGRSIRLLQLWSGMFDAMDLSLISVESVRAVSAAAIVEFDLRRFRSNIVIECAPYLDKPFPEDKFVGNLLKFGERDDAATMRCKRKDPRCMVVNIDPNSGMQTPGMLKEIVGSRKNNLGVYGTCERPGMIRVGDTVRMAKD